MIKKLPESEGSVIGFEISGKTSREESQELRQSLKKLVKQHGKISAVIVLKGGMRPGAKSGLRELRWLGSRTKKLNRLSFVSDEKVWKRLVQKKSPVSKMEGIGGKHFNLDQMDQAWDWAKG